MFDPGCLSMKFPRSYPTSSSREVLREAASMVNSKLEGLLAGVGVVGLVSFLIVF